MTWTNIPDKSTGDLMDETWYDSHFKANMEYLKAVTDDIRGGFTITFIAANPLHWDGYFHTTNTTDTVVDGSQHSFVPDDFAGAYVYFEAVLDAGGADTTVYASLYVDGSQIANSEVSHNTTTWTRKRSGDISGDLSGA